ncbi:MAG TPA: lysophospholipid acyltransferase family protein [Planctomycetota bacterium]
MKVRFSHRIVYWLARAAIGTAAWVPQWIGYTFADLLGRLFFRFDRRRRGYALHMLRNAYPQLAERELLRIGSRATGNLFKVPLDMARLTRLLARGGRIESVLDYRQADRTLASARPWLGLTAHLGNWEVGAVAVAQRVGTAHGVGRISRNPLLERWILANRARGGLTIHPRRGGIRGLAKALEAGNVGLMVVDQNQRLRGVFAPFFGETASCERSAITLALRRRYPIVIGVGLRRGRGFRFELVLSDPFVLERTGDKQKDLVAGVVRVNQMIEEIVRRAPEQYLWIHDRYRTQPPAGPS